MKITVANSAGFCFGVKNAVDTAYKHIGDDVCVLGELIHNPLVIEKLAKSGVKCIDNPVDVNTSKVIIRSHGAPEEVFEYFKSKNIEIIDATCPFVKKIHNIVSEKYKQGKQIIILGESNHSEVIGINGWCNNSAIIFDSIENVPMLSKNVDYCVVVQTTFSLEKYLKIIENIQKQSAKTVEFFNTICYTTKERQDEARLLAKTSSIVLVIGGKKSSNTLKLYDICKAHCDRVYLIEKIADLNSVKINKTDSLAIMAGASTPTELIEEVTNIMNQTENLDIAQKEAVEIAPEKKETMKDLFDGNAESGKVISYKAGKRLKATVINANEEGVFCSIGGKKDGFIAKEDATLNENYNPEDFKAGDIIDVKIIENKSKDKEYVALSKKEIDAVIEGDKKVAEILSGDEFKLVCDKLATNKAGKAVGLIGRLGSYTIFVPASQIRAGFVKNLEEYTKKELRLRVLNDKEAAAEGEEPVEEKRLSKRIVASQRVILEEEKAAREEAFWSEMQVGAVVIGKVKRFTEFGAFVSVKGFDCLARKSEISWTKIDKIEDVLELNEKYEFIILDVDREKGRISLGYKQLQKTPYEIANEQLSIGDVIKGKVVRIAPFGAFIEIIPGVDGLVHISQVTHDYIKTLDDVLKIGDEVEAKIIKIDDKKITLSIKELLPEPEVVENAEGEEAVEEKPARKPREKKSTKQEGETAERKPARKAKKEDDGQPHEWVDQSSATTTLGDLFAGINFDFKDSEDK